jgi:peptidoglycan/LPS O-acetylase OafA/YrhL
MAGTMGVWLFFLLSGFLIFRILHASRLDVEAGGSTPVRELGRFQLKRVLRIFPPYFALLGLAWCVWRLVDREEPGFPWYFSYLTNVYVGHVLHRWPAHFAPLWSLAVEEQFYLLAAPLMLWLPARRHAAALGLLLAFGVGALLAMTAGGLSSLAIYSSLLPAMAFFATGGLLALARPQRQWLPGPLALAAPVVAVIVFDRISPGSSFAPWAFVAVELTGLVTAALLLQAVVAGQSSALVRGLSWRPLAALGRISYGVYLYHDFVPRLQPGSGWLQRIAPWPAVADFVVFVATLAGTIGVALLSWWLLEAPMLRWKARLDRPPGARVGAAVA